MGRGSPVHVCSALMPPTDLIDSFTQAIRRLGVLYTRVAGQQSAAHDTFTKQELLAIGVLGVQGHARMGEVAEHLGVGQSVVTPIIDRLEARQLVRRRRSEEDRRVWLVELTEAGRRTFADEDAIYRQVAAEMLAPLQPQEREMLVALLEKVSAPNSEAV